MPQRLDHFPYREGWLWFLSAIALISLFGTVLLFIRDAEQNQQREQDRIEFDAGSCERSNEDRRRNVEVARAGAQLDRRIIELLVASQSQDRKNQIDRILAPAFTEYDKTVNKIKPVDCKELLRTTNGS